VLSCVSVIGGNAGRSAALDILQAAGPGDPRGSAAERLWGNPDCGLKTRQWAEVIPALSNMVAAEKTLHAGV